MKHPWFRPLGWIYKPTTWQGWLVTALAASWCIHIFIAVDRVAHSASDALYGSFPFVVPAFLLWLWIASKKSA